MADQDAAWAAATNALDQARDASARIQGMLDDQSQLQNISEKVLELFDLVSEVVNTQINNSIHVATEIDEADSLTMMADETERYEETTAAHQGLNTAADQAAVVTALLNQALTSMAVARSQVDEMRNYLGRAFAGADDEVLSVGGAVVNLELLCERLA